MLKNILLKIIFLIFITHSYAQSTEKTSYECDTSIVISIDKEGTLKQFLPGKVYFKINNNILTFAKLGYLTDEVVSIKRINENKFYSYQPAQTILYDNGLFHNLVFTYEGVTAVQARCLINKHLNLNKSFD